jgi:hypothetical protein
VNRPSCPGCGATISLCPACGAIVADTPGPGRPRVYCSKRCRWRAGHIAARDRAGTAAQPTPGELLDILAAQTWPG